MSLKHFKCLFFSLNQDQVSQQRIVLVSEIFIFIFLFFCQKKISQVEYKIIGETSDSQS